MEPLGMPWLFSLCGLAFLARERGGGLGFNGIQARSGAV